jgi:hypothetical protein
MKTLRSRLRRHLSYANVMATIAVFVVFGGISYAATTISGNKIIKGTVGAGKLKNGTITSNQVKADSLTGSVIDESTLTIVPAAQTATTATTAGSANTAKSAATAGSADSAKTADNAEHALSADTATSATTADNAATVEGVSAEQLRVTCPADTELFGGMCWDEVERPLRNWIQASSDCAEAGGRLPSVGELIAYVLRPGEQVAAGTQVWTNDLNTVGGSEEFVFTRGETTTQYDGALNSYGYRCLFYRVN